MEKVTESADFKEDLDADSLDLFEMVTALEDEYEIEIPEEDLPTLLKESAICRRLRVWRTCRREHDYDTCTTGR